MLIEKDIKVLLKYALKDYIKSLETNDLYYLQYKAIVETYLKVLEIQVKNIDLIKAKEILQQIEVV